MNYRVATSVLALSLSAFSAGNMYAAAPNGEMHGTPVLRTTAFAKTKIISFYLRNDSGSALTLQIGDQQMTVQAGKTADIRAQEGTQVVAVNAVGNTAAGAVLSTASPALNGNTLVVR